MRQPAQHLPWNSGESSHIRTVIRSRADPGSVSGLTERDSPGNPFAGCSPEFCQDRSHLSNLPASGHGNSQQILISTAKSGQTSRSEDRASRMKMQAGVGPGRRTGKGATLSRERAQRRGLTLVWSPSPSGSRRLLSSGIVAAILGRVTPGESLGRGMEILPKPGKNSPVENRTRRGVAVTYCIDVGSSCVPLARLLRTQKASGAAVHGGIRRRHTGADGAMETERSSPHDQ